MAFLCRNGVDAAGCCPEGEIYSYLASACVGTWCPAGLACENFTCSDGGAPPVPEGGAETDASVASDSAPADSTVADGAETDSQGPDAQLADSPEDVTLGDASADSMAADAATGTDAPTGADAGASDAAVADVNLPRAP